MKLRPIFNFDKNLKIRRIHMSLSQQFRGTFASLPVFALSVILSGCAVNTYSTGGPTSNVGLERVVRDPGLASDVQIDAARIDVRAGNKAAQLTLRNAGGFERKIAVEFSWFNAQGSMVSGIKKDWRDYTLRAGEVKEVISVGIPEAVDFRASIRNQ
jgi:uncharacterized protein YcfL